MTACYGNGISQEEEALSKYCCTFDSFELKSGELSMSLRKNISYLLKLNSFPRLEACYASAAAKRSQDHQSAASAKVTVVDMGKSIAAKGFLRPHKPYAAPANAAEKVRAICATLKMSADNNYKLSNLEEKFKFLEACFRDFQHSVPNSEVHELQTVGDVISFYECSVNTTVPYDALKQMDLPENLHVQGDYLRFHPETDTKFNGKSVFPKSSTLVTGLKYRGKYEGHEAKRSWP